MILEPLDLHQGLQDERDRISRLKRLAFEANLVMPPQRRAKHPSWNAL
jgi:hypothetical protein